MGEISSEPSMEEILSSIKRIIAEEGDAAMATRSRRGGRAGGGGAVTPRPDPLSDEVLELSDPMSDAPLQEKSMPMGAPTPPESGRPADPILSDHAAEATRGPLEALSRMVVKPEVAGSDSLEGMVREMLKPMLRDWLDANLPQVVESMVAKEISRITGRN